MVTFPCLASMNVYWAQLQFIDPRAFKTVSNSLYKKKKKKRAMGATNNTTFLQETSLGTIIVCLLDTFSECSFIM